MATAAPATTSLGTGGGPLAHTTLNTAGIMNVGAGSGRERDRERAGLTGPGAGGKDHNREREMGGGDRERERDPRERNWEQEREREHRERNYQRERQGRNNEPRDRERGHERERGRDMSRHRERDDGFHHGDGALPPPPIADLEYERWNMQQQQQQQQHYHHQQQQQQQLRHHHNADPVWQRFAPQIMKEDIAQERYGAPKERDPDRRDWDRDPRDSERDWPKEREGDRDGMPQRIRIGARGMASPRGREPEPEREREHERDGREWDPEKVAERASRLSRTKQAEGVSVKERDRERERERDRTSEVLDGRDAQSSASWGTELDMAHKEQDDVDHGRPGPSSRSAGGGSGGQPLQQPPYRHHHVQQHRHPVPTSSSSSTFAGPPGPSSASKTSNKLSASVAGEGPQPATGIVQQQTQAQQQQTPSTQRQGTTKTKGPGSSSGSGIVQVTPTPHQALQQHLDELAMHAGNARPHPHPLAPAPAHYHPFLGPPPSVIGPPFPLYTHSRPPSPRPPPLPPIHLGTFVYPRTPFPFLDFPTPLRDVLATILVPSTSLPASRPANTARLWGGALLITRTRVYTDDSDIILCAVHAGWVTWTDLKRARAAKRDLRLEVALTKETRFIGGFGAKIEDVAPDEDGSMLLSAGWGNSHDGAGVQIIDAKFINVSQSHLEWIIFR